MKFLPILSESLIASDSGESEDLSYVEETDNENQQKNLKLMNG